MANKNYRKGYRFERAVVKHLQSLGYEAVRAYASKGAFGEDITAWDDHDGRYLIQCKADGKRQGMMQAKEWNRFLRSTPPGYAPILANGTPSRIRYHLILGERKEGLKGYQAMKDVEENMTDFEFDSVEKSDEKREKSEEENDEYFG